jgi:(E)-4-hydroxy-3-methylbut-2-enyl-diphosphate synthase
MTVQDSTCKTVALPRRKTIQVKVGNVPVGSDSPVSVQTMVKVPTTDVDAVLRQIESTAVIDPEQLDEREINILKDINAWEDACALRPFYCDITRVSVPNDESAAAFAKIVKQSPIPVVSDIHFRADMALAALDAGTDKLRINPGNISNPKLLRKIAQQAVEKNIPIRVGVNAGSLAKDLLQQYGEHSAEALAISAERSVRLIEEEGVKNILVSMKANDARWTIDAYKLFAQKNQYPLHVGVTEAGAGRAAIVNSWAGVGSLLQQGIGDTIRISLTEDPRLEVVIGHLLLHYLGLPRLPH